MRYVAFSRQAELIKNRLVKINDYVKQLLPPAPRPPEPKREKLRSYMEEVEQKYRNFQQLVENLYVGDETSDINDQAVGIYSDEISEIYGDVKAAIRTLLKSEENVEFRSNAAPPTTPTPPTSSVRLPKFDLPHFSGDLNGWIYFSNLFEKTIHHNECLSEIERFQYLLSSLRGEALNVIKGLPISAANYEIAWSLLHKRYHNIRRLVTNHVSSIIDLPSINGSLKSIRNFLDIFRENTQALTALGYGVTNEDLLLSTLLLRKLNQDTRKRFEDNKVTENDIPSINDLIDFLEKESSRLEDATIGRIHPHDIKNAASSRPLKATILSVEKALCNYCRALNHNVYNCDSFLKLSAEERRKFAHTNGWCYNCLGTSHSIQLCKSTHSCKTCKKRHHSLLHLPHSASTSLDLSKTPACKPTPPSNPAESSHPDAFVGFSSAKATASVILATTLVKLSTPEGNSCVVRGVLDSAAQTSCISEHCAQLLRVKRFKSTNFLSGLSQASLRTRGITNLNIHSLNGQSLAQSHSVQIVDNISSNLPQTTISKEVRQRVCSLVLADPTFDIPCPVDILIGADLFAIAFTGQRLPIGPDLPVAFGTIFGFVLMGACSVVSPQDSLSENKIFFTITDMDLHTSIQKFWQIEEPPSSTLSPEEIYAEEHFARTFKRDPSGKYIVRLPFKKTHPNLGDSSAHAKKRFFSLERRFLSQPDYKSRYVDFMQDYLDSGHMTPCTSSKILFSHYFIPHHGVFKQHDPDKKLRVVFDASARTSNNVSLNDILLPGPKLQNSINDVILHFRRHLIVFSCDITQMFRNIMLHPDDQPFQLIYWRSQPSEPLQQYKLATVTYGMTSSPFLAIRTLQQLAQDERETFPLAAQVLLKQTFVDDIITGSDTLEEALTLKDELTKLLRFGGFTLHKWCSNSPHLLGSTNSPHQFPNPLRSSSTQLHGILGLQWDPNEDVFSYKVNIAQTQFTKRSVLSSIAKLYDPCGWIAPVVFWAKSFMQMIWTLGLAWDDQLPPEIIIRWKRFLNDLPHIANIRLQRQLFIAHPVSIQLHGFSDASQQGYSAVIYVRSMDASNTLKSSILVAKTRVSPLKRISLPRLELCGAHLLAKLLNYSSLQLSPHIEIESTSAWCDSTIVLSWIQTPSYRLKTYVANRVSQIQEWIPSHLWNHVTSDQNPADLASRGLAPSQLLENPLWWEGPKWLVLPSQERPVSGFARIDDRSLPEIIQTPLNILLSQESTDWDLLTKFSSWTKMQRVLAYALRFISACKSKKMVEEFLTSSELKRATIIICKSIQTKYFKEDLAALHKQRPCSLRIRRLSPFIDKDGLLRAGGRLTHSNLAYEVKHPIILPKNHHVVNLIVDYYHTKYLHAGPQLLQSILCQQFWILSARSVVRTRIFKCIRCYRCKPKNNPPLMGDLPAPRVTPARPFLRSGMDYGGPFEVKIHTLKRAQLIKVYLCIFVCFSTKAVHIEVVNGLTAEAFIAAMTRFVSRRGLCKDLFSDCGTNFKGASNRLASVMKKTFLSKDFRQRVSGYALENSINFHFLPPASPHQGGLWESAIKSAKGHLARVIGREVLTLEEFITLSTKVEAMLNSRPLTPLSTDPSETTALTPGHFLIGCSLQSVPEEDFTDMPQNRLSRWHMIQSLSQRIWKRWHQEYLHTLQQRLKWTSRGRELNNGDLVLVHNPHAPPLQWCLARVVKTYPGKDGIVRVVQLRTQESTFSRPATKLFPLPQC